METAGACPAEFARRFARNRTMRIAVSSQNDRTITPHADAARRKRLGSGSIPVRAAAPSAGLTIAPLRSFQQRVADPARGQKAGRKEYAVIYISLHDSQRGDTFVDRMSMSSKQEEAVMSAILSRLALAGIVSVGLASASIAQGTGAGPVGTVCSKDIQRFCKGMRHGTRDVRLCLEAKLDQVSLRCRQALSTTGEGWGWRR